MPWVQLSWITSEQAAGRMEALLWGGGAVSVTLTQAGGSILLEQEGGPAKLWRRTRVTGLFDGQAAARRARGLLEEALPDAGSPAVEILEDRDWEREWMSRFQPLRFGNRLCVRATWTSSPWPDVVELVLDPGLAFGTGTHASTALCLEWLSAADLAGATVVDYGCGSGILAIAALLLGARCAYAVDVDENALSATCENARRNGVAERITAVSPQRLSPVEADVLLANILEQPLKDLAPRLGRLVRPGGRIVLAGITQCQAASLSEVYADTFEMQPPVVRDRWACIAGTRTSK